MVTMSPDSMLSTGLTLAAKCPICTVCGLGISVCSAANAGSTRPSATATLAAISMGCALRFIMDVMGPLRWRSAALERGKV